MEVQGYIKRKITEEPLQAYLSPVLSQALTNFIKELK